MVAQAEIVAACEIMRVAAVEAGEIVMPYFRHGAATSASVEAKAGGSPVTQADLAADRHLRGRLLAAMPDAGWLSEETADDESRLQGGRVFIVDPIDGTRGFMAGDPRFAVCIGLVIDGRAVAGIIHAPALGETYAATLGGGATLNGAPLAASRRAALAGASVACPKDLAERLARNGLRLDVQPRIPSLAYRFACVATGRFDAAFAAPNSHDWDIAAADVILHEAGARLTGLDGAAIAYNRQSLAHGHLVAAPPQLQREAIAALGAARA